MSLPEAADGGTQAFVNERHRLLHYRLVASGIVEAIGQLVEPNGGRRPVVLDHGCGEALAARDVARRCARLYLCEAKASLRGELAAHFADSADVQVIAPLEVADIAEASLDLVVAQSPVQDLTPAEFASALRLWRRALKPQGRLLIADVVPKGLSPMADPLALVRFGWRGGFLFAALPVIVRAVFARLSRSRAEASRVVGYDEKEMIALLDEAGFKAERHRPNLGHDQTRMAFLATPSRA